MKQGPDLKKIQSNMRPGVITIQGFLGTDGRDLSQIIDEDASTVTDLGISHLDLSSKMKFLRDEGAKGLGEFIDVPPHFSVRVDSVRGKLRCPFEDPGLIPKTNTTVHNLETGESITYTDLNIHFIEVHGFYQGKGSNFRLSPTKIAKVLEVSEEPSA